MIVIQHVAPMAFQVRFALLSISREHRTDKICVATGACIYHISGAQAARSF